MIVSSSSVNHSVFSTLCDSMDCRYSSGKNTAVGSHSLLQGIFPTQGLNPRFLHCGKILYLLSHQGRGVQTTEWEFVRTYYTTQEIPLILCSNFKWNITFKNCIENKKFFKILLQRKKTNTKPSPDELVNKM